MIPASPGSLPAAERDGTGLVYAGEMYGLQIDQLAALLDLTADEASAAVARWTSRGFADSAELGPGPPWLWLTTVGLRACGLPYHAAQPGLSRLAHLRAVTAVRLALEAAPLYADGGAHWRSERRLRSHVGGRLGSREHLPDAEVHWPDASGLAWAGECWAIEAELAPKTVSRTTAIMRELLARTGDYGCPPDQARVPGVAARHARAVYLCTPAASRTVARARAALGSLAARVEIRALPDSAAWP